MSLKDNARWLREQHNAKRSEPMPEPTVMPVNPAFATPMAAIMAAVATGNTEIVSAMIALQERHEALLERREANEARKAFEAAMAQAAGEMPAIVKDVSVDFTSQRTSQRTSYKHEDLGKVLDAVRPVLARHGLNVRWRTDVVERGIRVTCRVVHSAGHFEETSLPGTPDESGQKNPMQAMGSSLSYLQRYTLKAALGLAAARDDDARSSSEPPANLSQEQIAGLEALISNIKDQTAREKVLRFVAVASIDAIPAKKHDRVLSWLRAKKQAEIAAEATDDEFTKALGTAQDKLQEGKP